MLVQTRSCPACQQEWTQRDARFCGHCGTALASEHTVQPRKRRRRSALTVRAIGAAVIAAILVAAMTMDLSLPQRDTAVDVDEDLTTAENPLSAEEARELRRQSDPDRLRCEPRGCELWRLPRGEAAMNFGAAPIGDDLLLLIEGGSGPEGPAAGVLQGVDITTGEVRWERPIEDVFPGGGEGWSRLQTAGDGALLTYGGRVAAIDADGATLWVWTAPSSGDGSDSDLWVATATDDVVVVVESHFAEAEDGRWHQATTVLDRTTANELWTASEAMQVTPLDQESIAVTELDGSLRSLDLVTGEVRWEFTDGGVRGSWPSGPWLLVNTDGGVAFLDPSEGTEVNRFGGWFNNGLARVGDRWLGVLIEADLAGFGGVDDENATGVELVVLDAAGATSWSQPLRPLEEHELWDCCLVSADPDEDRVTIRIGEQQQEYDLSTGALLGEGSNPAAEGEDGMVWLGQGNIWEPMPGVELERGPRGSSIEVRTSAGSVTVRAGLNFVNVYAADPLIVGDDHDLIGVRPVVDG